MSVRRRAVVVPLLCSVLLVACGGLGLDDLAPEPPRAQGAADEATDPARPDAPGPATDPPPAEVLLDPVLCWTDDADCPDVGVGPDAMLCTATVQLDGTPALGDLVGTLTFEGRPLAEARIPEAEVPTDRAEPVSIFFGLGGLSFPNGRYVCEIALGSAGGFTLDRTYGDGVDAALWEAWVCDRDDAVQLTPEVLVCTTDADELPDGTSAFTCSAGTAPDGQEIAFELEVDLDDEGPQDRLEVPFGAPDLGVAAVNGTVDAVAFGGQPGDPLPNGDYRCRFRVGDEDIERRFRLG